MNMNYHVFMASSFLFCLICMFIHHSFIVRRRPLFLSREKYEWGEYVCHENVLRTKMFEMIMFYATEIKHPRFWTLKALVFGSHKTVYCNKKIKRTVGVSNKCIFLNVQGI